MKKERKREIERVFSQYFEWKLKCYDLESWKSSCTTPPFIDRFQEILVEYTIFLFLFDSTYFPKHILSRIKIELLLNWLYFYFFISFFSSLSLSLSLSLFLLYYVPYVAALISTGTWTTKLPIATLNSLRTKIFDLRSMNGFCSFLIRYTKGNKNLATKKFRGNVALSLVEFC